jgi:hypothetical protein
MADDDERVKAIEDDIVQYLSQRPDAADTLRGIRQWWLSRTRADDSDADIQRALDDLVDRGAVTTIRLADGSVMYANARH